MALVLEGDGWASLPCLAIQTDLKRTTEGSVVIERWEKTIYLACKCGREYTLPFRHFTGKRKIRDCGCGLSSLDLEPRAVTTISLPHVTLRQMKMWAGEHGLNLSQAITRMFNAVLNGGSPTARQIMDEAQRLVPLSTLRPPRTRHSLLTPEQERGELAEPAPLVCDPEPEFAETDFR